jgi:haloacetate dehalogenase
MITKDGSMNIFETADQMLLPLFHRQWIEVSGNKFRVLIGGDGPPLLMLHGDPQTHLCWHRIAPSLTDRYTVILPDITGRGETHKPSHDKHHHAYSKREMASEQMVMMQKLGFDQFYLVGHDRGARIAHRLTLDYPKAVKKLTIMDIVPVLDLYKNTTAQSAQDYFYFYFLTQNYPIPDQMITKDAEAFLKLILFGLSSEGSIFNPHAVQAYLTANTTPEAITAMCKCFRAGLHVDYHQEARDFDLSNQITCPTPILWGEHSVVGKHFDVETIWRNWCLEPKLQSLTCGHFIPEEEPEKTLSSLRNFLNEK